MIIAQEHSAVSTRPAHVFWTAPNLAEG